MLLIYLVCFLDLLSLGILLPVAPVHLISIGASRFLIGGLTSLNAFLQITSGPLVGSWSDTKGRRTLLINCSIFILISNLLLLFTSSLSAYIASRILFGLTGHIQILIRAIVACKVPKTQQNEAFAKIGAAAGLSFVVGPLLGGVLNSTSNGFFKIAVVLNIFAAMNLVCSFFVKDISMKKDDKVVKSKPIILELTQAFTNLREVEWDTFWDIFLFKFLCESGYSAFFTSFGIIFMDYFKATQGQMALTISLFSVTMIVINLSITRINGMFYKEDVSGYHRNLHGFLGLLSTFVFLYYFTGFWSYIIVMVAMGIFRGILDTTWTEMLMSRTSESNKGTITGSFESVFQMANLVTPLLTTFIGENHGYLQTYLLTIMFLFIGTFVGVYRLQSNQHRIKSE